jgi:hypothetical protein
MECLVRLTSARLGPAGGALDFRFRASGFVLRLSQLGTKRTAVCRVRTVHPRRALRNTGRDWMICCWAGFLRFELLDCFVRQSQQQPR